LSKLAFEYQIIYNRVIQPPGHGKCLVDALNGLNKTLLDAAINTKTAILKSEKNSDANAPKMEIHQVDEHGNRVSAAAWAYKELTSSERPCGVYGAWSKNKKAASKVVMQRNYHHREEDLANLDSLKKKAEGFNSGLHNGMQAHYNYVGDGVLLDVGEVACRRIPCSCEEGCMLQRKKPTKEERYGPSPNCVLRPIMEMEDGGSYNDFCILNMVDAKGHDQEQEVKSMVVALKGYGETVAEGVEVGGYGAYIVDDHDYDYYLCRWTAEPFRVEQDEDMWVGEGEDPVQVFEGDWVCRGIRLEKLPQAKNWWTMTDRPCLVRMQEVVHTGLQFRPRSDTNPLPRRRPKSVIDHADKMGAWFLKDADHQYMTLRRRQIEGLDYPEELFDDLAENMMDEDNEAEVESGESEGSSDEDSEESEEECSSEEEGSDGEESEDEGSADSDEDD